MPRQPKADCGCAGAFRRGTASKRLSLGVRTDFSPATPRVHSRKQKAPPLCISQMPEGSSFSTSLTTLAVFLFFIVMILTGMRSHCGFNFHFADDSNVSFLPLPFPP